MRSGSLVGVFFGVSVAAMSLIAALESRAQYYVPDVVDQFQKLAIRPDGLGFSIGNTHDPSLNKHYQGMARSNGTGTPYLFVTKSGNDTLTCVGCSDDPGQLIVVKMESRDTNGERMRTNRLIRDWFPFVRDADGNVISIGGVSLTWTKPPDPRDKVVRTITFDGQNGLPSYRHPGGVQLVDDVLAIPMENQHSSGGPKLSIQFLDVSDPENPSVTSSLPLVAEDYPIVNEIFSAGVVGITRVLNPLGPGNRYLMIVTGKNSREIRLFRSRPTSSDGSTDLKSPHLAWDLLKTDICPPVLGPSFPPDAQDVLPSLTGCARFPDDWKTGVDSYQMLNFVRQGGSNGELFLIGGFNSGVGGVGDDLLQLFRVNVDQYGTPGPTLLTNLVKKQVTSFPVNGHGDSAALSAAAGIYVSPSGELIIYATEYENDGPYELLPGTFPGHRTVRFAEWRHREIVRPDSPTYRPTVQAGGPFVVDEGSAIMLSGQGRPPITKAWLQLFEDDGAGLNSSFDDDAWLLMDYSDYDEDHFDNLETFDGTTDTDYNDNAGSWRWFAPFGCNMRVNAGTFFNPVRGQMLVGNGQVNTRSNLDNEPAYDVNGNTSGNMDDMISSIQIRRTAGGEPLLCENYYAATIGVSWDMNSDGTFETAGNSPLFSAFQLDGPASITVHARAQHSTDITALGQSGPIPVTVQIRNVAPVITSLNLKDPLGSRVGIDVPFALPYVQYTAEGTFTDAGRPDRQTASLNLGDGTVISSGGFDQFSDAFGGMIGLGRRAHVYAASGNFELRLSVTDDDGGSTTTSRNIHVASPLEILQWVVSQLDGQLAIHPTGQYSNKLRDARDKLIGNNSGSANNGAIDKIASGELTAGLVKLKQAIEAIQSAEAQGGVDLSLWKLSISLAAESIAQKAYADAVARVGTPSASQAAKLERSRRAIADGHARVLSGQYASSIDYFKDGLTQAQSL